MNTNEDKIKKIKDKYPNGTEIELIEMNDPYAVPIGTHGIVDFVDDIGTIFVKWDNGSSLGLVLGEDKFKVIKKPNPKLEDLKKAKKQIEKDENLFLHTYNQSTGYNGVASFIPNENKVKVFEGDPNGFDDKIISYDDFLNNYKFAIAKEFDNPFLNQIIEDVFYTNENLDISGLTMLYNKIYKPKLDVEFTDNEVNEFNKLIHEKDISAIMDFFKTKEMISKENAKRTLNENTYDIWRFVMDCAYDKWEDSNISREEFLDQLTEYEKDAVIFGNFNYQVENGGLTQWYCNDFGDDSKNLYDFLSKSDFIYKENFIEILEAFDYVIDEINKLDKYSDWYEQDFQTRLDYLNMYDDKYNKISNAWRNYFEDYLIDNMPDEYIDKIKNFNFEKINI